MKTKIFGLVALAFAFTLMTAQKAVADGIHEGQDSDFNTSDLDFNFHATVHSDALINDRDDVDRDGDHKPTFDHDVAHEFSPVPDCGCGTGNPPAQAPEPSPLVLMAAGLTPFLLLRRRNGGL